MSLRLNGSTSGYSELEAPAVAGDQTFTLPGTGGTLDRLNRAGNILQVVSVTKADAFQTTSTSYVDVTGLSVSITPTSSANKVLAIVNVALSISGDDNGYLQLVRNSTAIANGTAGTNASFAVVNGNVTAFQYSLPQQSISYLDSPNTISAVTYKIQTRTGNAAYTINVNRRNLDTSHSGSSTITLLEVAA